MRKRWIACLIFAFILLFSIIVYGASDTMKVEANIFAPIVSVEVPDYVYFGNLSKGYESNEINITINNTGNIDISVTPRLADNSERIFNYTYFKKTSSDTYRIVGMFNVNISRPGSSSNVKVQSVYAKLDLTDYDEDIPEDMLNHKTDIIFWAVER